MTIKDELKQDAKNIKAVAKEVSSELIEITEQKAGSYFDRIFDTFQAATKEFLFSKASILLTKIKNLLK